MSLLHDFCMGSILQSARRPSVRRGSFITVDGITPVPSQDGSKLFVLDTNVILHDAGCLRNFQENAVAVPITVLEELDRFKKGEEDVNFQARVFLRRLDELTGDVLSTAGTSLGPGLGSIRVVRNRITIRSSKRPSSRTAPITGFWMSPSACGAASRRGR